MATAQTNGSASTSSSTDNNGGTIKANGSGSGTFNASKTAQNKTGVFGSTVVDNNVADKALSAGSFAYNNARPIAKKTTDSLSGVANTVLQSGAADPNGRKSIHKIESVVTRKLTTAIRNNKWNEYSGEWEAGFPQSSTDNFGNDDAANPNSSVPGELTYKTGAKLPVNDDYKAKTNY
jgi:hypothetical protein